MTIISYSDEKNVVLHWMRHAVTCADILKMFNLIGIKGVFKSPGLILKGTTDIRKVLTPDSKLSNIGIDYSREIIRRELESNKEKIPYYLFKDEIDDKIRIVLTSNLKRAIETAIYSFGYPYVKIIPVPYIGEESTPPSSIDKLKIEMNELAKNVNPNIKLIWDFLEEKRYSMTEVSSEKFDNEILPRILWKYKPRDIVIVSHSNFILKRCKNKSKDKDKCRKLNNLEIIDEILPYKNIVVENASTRDKIDVEKNMYYSGTEKEHIYESHKLVSIVSGTKTVWKSVKEITEMPNELALLLKISGDIPPPKGNIPRSVHDYNNCNFPDNIKFAIGSEGRKIIERSKKFIERNPIKSIGFIQTFSLE